MGGLLEAIASAGVWDAIGASMLAFLVAVAGHQATLGGRRRRLRRDLKAEIELANLLDDWPLVQEEVRVVVSDMVLQYGRRVNPVNEPISKVVVLGIIASGPAILWVILRGGVPLGEYLLALLFCVGASICVAVLSERRQERRRSRRSTLRESLRSVRAGTEGASEEAE